MAIGLFEIRSKDAFGHVVHHRSPDGQPRIGFFFFTAVLWQGEPANLEPNKCAGLHWANPARPPANTVRYTAERMLQAGVRHLPVLGAGDVAIGMVSARDLFCALTERVWAEP